jgi:hypothetical protein
MNATPFFIEIINSTIGSAIYLAKNQLSSAKYYILIKLTPTLVGKKITRLKINQFFYCFWFAP